jgi:hypothetical protein
LQDACLAAYTRVIKSDSKRLLTQLSEETKMGFSIVQRREAAQAAVNQIADFLKNASVDSSRIIIVGDMKLSFPLIAGIEDGRLFIWIDVFSKEDDLLEGDRDRMTFENRNKTTTHHLFIDENGLIDPDWFLLQVAEEIRILGA